MLNKEKKEKEKYKYKDFIIFLLENGVLIKKDEKEIKDHDYLIFNYIDKIIIIDRDKRKIRPFVENLLTTMDIETKNTKMIRINLILTFLFFGIIIFSIFLTFMGKNQISNLSKEFKKIEKVKLLEKNINNGIL